MARDKANANQKPLTLEEMQKQVPELDVLWWKLQALQKDMAYGSAEYDMVEVCQKASETLGEAVWMLHRRLS